MMTISREVVDELLQGYQKPEDLLVVKVNQEGKIANRHIYLAIGVGLDGRKEVRGLWAAHSEGAKFRHARGDGTETACGGRHPDRLCRWVDRFSRSDQERLPADSGAGLHCASGPELAPGGDRQGSDSRGGGAQGDISGSDGRSSAGRADEI